MDRPTPGSRLAVAVLLAANVTAAAGAATGAATGVAALKEAACDAEHASASRDIDALDRLTAQDYSQADLRGAVLKRAEWLEFVGKRTSTLTIKCGGVEVNLCHGTAVVTGGWTYTNHKPDADLVTHSRWTSVWTKERATWKRHAFQNTCVNPAAGRCAADPAS